MLDIAVVSRAAAPFVCRDIKSLDLLVSFHKQSRDQDHGGDFANGTMIDEICTARNREFSQ